MHITVQLRPSRVEPGDAVRLEVQLLETEEKIYSVYAKIKHNFWQLKRTKENIYTANVKIPPSAISDVYTVSIFAEDKKGKKLAQVSIPLKIEEKREIEEESGFEKVNQIIEELELLKFRSIVQDNFCLKDKIENYILSLKVAKKLLSSKIYQTSLFLVEKKPTSNKSQIPQERLSRLKEILSEGVEKVNIKALKEGRIKEFEESISFSLNSLKPVQDFAKEYTLHLTANAHIDMAWLWRWEETVQVCHDTFASVIDKMRKFFFTFTQSQSQAYKWIEERYPKLFEKIKEAVTKGRWEIVGGMWVEPDCNLIDGESWVRQILYGKKYFKEKFGKEVNLGWNIDSFGYNWNMPQIYKKSGIDAFVTQKIGWNDTNIFPYHLFWWEAPDGSRILTYFPYERYNFTIQPYRFVDLLKQFEANTGLRDMMILFGIGDHGGGPTDEMLLEVEKLKEIYIYPKVVYGTAREYIERIKKQVDIDELPVWKDELYLEYHRGTYTTQAKTKYNNRKSEALLEDAEKISTLASLYGAPYYKEELAFSWEKVMFNQFHDILPGSSIKAVYEDAEEDYKKIKKMGEYILRKSLAHIASKVDIKKSSGKPLIIFNSLFWEREEMVSIPLPEKNYIVEDNKGNTLPSQIIEEEDSASIEKKYKLLCRVKLPSFGYTTVLLKKDTQLQTKSKKELKVENYTLENEFFKIEINPETGNIRRIYDKRYQREVLEGEGNELQILEEDKLKSTSWDIVYTGKKWILDKPESIEVIEEGPLRGIIRIKRSFLGDTKLDIFWDTPARDYPSSHFTQDIILYGGIPRIDFITTVDWWEDNKLLKVCFPVKVKSDYATYEIPFGTIHRSTTEKNSWEKAKFEVPALRWADLSDKDYGVTLLNEAKYGYDIRENRIRLTLLRSPTSERLKSVSVPDPTADRGKHVIRYSLFPHKGNWREALVYRKAYEFNFPPYINFIENFSGKEQQEKSFFKVEPNNVVVSSFKRCEHSEKDLILRLYEVWGKEGEVKIQLPIKCKKIFKTNLLEDPEEEIKLISEDEVKVNIKAYEILTLRIQPK